MDLQEKLARLYAKWACVTAPERENNVAPWEKLHQSERDNAEGFAQAAIKLVEEDRLAASRRYSIMHSS